MNAEEVVGEFIRRIEAKDLDAACELVTADLEYDNVPIGKTYGPEGIKSVLGPMVAVDEVEFRVLRQIAAGDTVMNERVDRFRIGERWMELPVAGVFVVNGEGLITLWRDYFDMQTLTEQMNAVAAAQG
ncbi:limonene-1,2-epoxide hydrolase family protein [Rhabdothermincola sp.]|uniref:limonene-1,2-epoxide hydrolase family protein n=1 Tax=Rhabdothermincola sp. TaxID=2820405 RepID=UPI002FE3CB15